MIIQKTIVRKRGTIFSKILRYDRVMGPPTPWAAIPPINVTAIAMTTTEIQVSWDDINMDTTFAQIEVSSDPTWTSLAGSSTVPANPGGSASDNFTSLANLKSVPYYVRVRVTNAIGYSSWVQITFVPPIDALISFSAVPGAASGSADLGWADPGDWAVDYELHWANNPGLPAANQLVLPANPMSGSTHTVTGLVTGIPAFFAIRARNIGGESAWVQASTVPT